MKNLAGRGGLHDLHIGVGCELHEAFQPCRTVLGSLAFVAVGQHEREAVEPPPFHFTAGNELVDHDLCAVGKIAKLRLPDHQGARIVGGIAVFKSQHGFFRQNGVDHGKIGLAFVDVLQRNVDAFVEFFAVLVVQHGMAVGEGAAAAVLPGNAHRESFGQQGGKSHVFAHAPIHEDVAAPHGGAVVEYFARQRMHVEPFRHAGDAFGNAPPVGRWNRGVGGVGPLLVQVGHPVDREVALVAAQYGVDGVAFFVHGSAVGAHHVFAQRVAQPLRSQAVGIELARAGVLGDLLVHQRLGEHGGVLLVVAQLAKAHDVHHHVLVERGAVFHGPLHAQRHGFGVVAIDVQHGGAHHLDHIGAIQGGAAVARVTGGKADLVVDHDVQGAARVVAPRFGQRQRFHHHALPGKSRIAMHQQGQHVLAFGVAAAVHARTHRTLHHRVDDFQVRGVEGQAQVQRAVGRGNVGTEALVVFHVAAGQAFGDVLLEFGKQFLGQLAQQVHQHVQAAAVRHADHYFLQAALAGFMHHGVHGDDEAFSALERKTLLAHVLAVQKTLQAFCGGQAVEDAQFAFGIEHRLGPAAFHFLLPPAFLIEIAGVHEFGANGPGIGFAQRVEQLAQGHAFLAEKGVAGIEHRFQVGIGEAVKIQFQFRNHRAFGALDRIEVGPARARIAVCGNELLGCCALAADVGIGVGVLHLGAALFGAFDEGADDRLVWHVFAVAAVYGGKVLQVVEIFAPGFGHAAGVGQIVFVHLLHIRGVAAKQVCIGAVGAINR